MPVPYVANAPKPFPGDETPDLEAILLEVKKGCPHHEKRLCEAREIQQCYDGDSERFVAYRPAEDNIAWLSKPKRVSFITRQAVENLCGHLFKPGPRHRRIGADEKVDRFYNQVAQDIHLNSVMHQADRLVTLHGICAIGVYPTGVPSRPINYHLFPRQDFTFWASPDDPRVATAVCTITKTGPDTTRYRLWTATHFYTFFRGKAWGYAPGGMTVARYDPGSSDAHDYGSLPFTFPTHELPTTELETKGLGYLLAKVNKALNTEKSHLASWVHHYARPLGFVSGVGPEWRPKFVDGGFIPLVVRHDSTEDAPVVPEARYLESQLDIGAIRQWIISEANQALEELGVPITIGVQTDGARIGNAPSGVSIAAQDADLITYAKARQPLFNVHETNLCKLVCRIAASPSGKMGAFAANLERVADDPSLRVAWPEPQIDLPGQARDLADQWELEAGITDPIEILMRRQNLTEEEAIAQYRNVQRRRAQAVKIAELATQAIDDEGNVIDTPVVPESTTTLDETDGEPGGVPPDMGVPSGGPSSETQPETSVVPSVTFSNAVLPSTPIGELGVYDTGLPYSGGSES